jgi:ornithine cyclodeaminase/alanine dehydrogenase-like protein (mu-crystallin family)
MNMEYEKLVEGIGQVFIDQDQYFFDKHVPEFKKDGKFFADYFSQLAVEPLSEKAPRFYHFVSPFDVVSNQAPQVALIFEGGELIRQMDFAQYVVLRTAAMSAVVLKGLGVASLEDKKVLLFGAGKTASEAVKILAATMGLKSVDVVSKSGDLTKIKDATNSTGVIINHGNAENISAYDIIICHTNCSSPVITPNQLNSIKQGAIIASFITSTEHGELPDELYDSARANVIVDWPQTIAGAKDLQRAVNGPSLEEATIITLKELLSGAKIDINKQYTVYRSTGTPIQNLAVAKLLV